MPLVELLRSEYAIIQELSLVALARATQDGKEIGPNHV